MVGKFFATANSIYPFYFVMSRLCGSTPPASPITSKSNQMMLYLHTDESEARKGFSASYVINPCAH